MKYGMNWLHLNSVRKKVFFLSKLSGGMIVLFYLITTRLPLKNNSSFLLWFLLLIAVILFTDFLLGLLISKPLAEINHTASLMSKLDTSARSRIQTNDEFGELSGHLNLMFENLIFTLKELETAKNQLEQDILREHFLLTQRQELADSLSHEMKTPLGIIRAYTDGLREESDETKRQEYLDVISAATGRMNSMIISLLDLSALEAGAAVLTEECFDFVELVETTAGRLLLDAPNADFTLSYDLPEEKILVLADRSRMEQVLNNVILNAKNYTFGGGLIHLSVKRYDGKFKFTVFNEGTSIPEPELPLIWKKFYRASGNNRKNSGSGLGLATVAGILNMYHSDFGIQNKGDGVLFYFDFTPISQS